MYFFVFADYALFGVTQKFYKKAYNLYAHNELKCYFFLYIFSPISREFIVFGSNFRSGDIDGFTHF